MQADASSVPILIAVAMILILGYVGRAIFNRTKIPEALILILIGLLLVPIAHLLPVNYVGALRSLAAVFGDIALTVIMYNGGKAIVLNRELLNDSNGLMLGFLDTLLPTIVLAIVMKIGFGWPLIYGAIMGAALGETSAVIILPLIRKIEIPQGIFNSLVMEVTLNSVFAILFFELLLSFAGGQVFSPNAFVNLAVDYVSVAIAIGLIAGLLWLLVQSYIKGAREYLATIAMAILLYGIVELFNGAAAIAVLIFAIILGNYKPITKHLGISININEAQKNETQAVEKGLEFLIITFFFVFIGMIALLSVQYFEYAIAITIILCIIRYAEVAYVLGGKSEYRDVVFALMQRGTVVAVLSAILFSIGGHYYDQIFYICFMTIILTNILGSIFVSQSKMKVKQ